MSPRARHFAALAALACTGCEALLGLGEFAANTGGAGAEGVGAASSGGAGGAVADGGGAAGAGSAGGGGPGPTFLWARVFEGDASVGDLAASSKAVAMTGDINGTFTIDRDHSYDDDLDEHVYVAQLAPDGALVWAIGPIAAGEQHATGVAIGSSDDDVYFGGSYVGALVLDGETLTSAATAQAFAFDLGGDGNADSGDGSSGTGTATGTALAAFGASVCLAGDFAGTVTLAGQEITATDLDTDAFVAKLMTAGGDDWRTPIGGTGAQHALSAVVDDNQSYVAGWFDDELVDTRNPTAGMDDGFVARLGNAGNIVWTMTFGGTGVDHATDVAAVGGVIAVAGYTESGMISGLTPGSSIQTHGQQDAIVAKRDFDTGGPLWGAALGSDKDERATRVSLGHDGSVYVGGEHESSFTVAGQLLETDGEQSCFLAKLDPDGMALWGVELGNDKRCTLSGLASYYDAPNARDVIVIAGQFAGAMTVAGEIVGQDDLGDAVYVIALTDP